MKVNSLKTIFFLRSLILGIVLLVLLFILWLKLWTPTLISSKKNKDLHRFNQQTELHLHSYGKIKGEEDYVHIPIGKAFDHLLKQKSKK